MPMYRTAYSSRSMRTLIVSPSTTSTTWASMQPGGTKGSAVTVGRGIAVSVGCGGSVGRCVGVSVGRGAAVAGRVAVGVSGA